MVDLHGGQGAAAGGESARGKVRERKERRGRTREEGGRARSMHPAPSSVGGSGTTAARPISQPSPPSAQERRRTDPLQGDQLSHPLDEGEDVLIDPLVELLLYLVEVLV